MENYSVQVPPYTVGPEAYRQIEKQCHIYGKKAVVVGGKKAMAAAKDKLLAAVRSSTAGGYDICCWWRKGN